MTKPQISILVVEDDVVDRKGCRRALSGQSDYEFLISEAENGLEGLALAHTLRPDCVLLDYHLPDMNGLEFLAQLADDTGGISIPVMMLTGADNAAVAVEAMRRGARDYLVKDTQRQYLELLPAVIQRVLREQTSLREKRQTEQQLLQAEAKYRTLVEQIPAITYVAALDEPGSILYVSPQIKTLGYSPEEWLAAPETHLKQVHAEDRVRVLDELAKSRATGKPLRCEYRLVARNGSVSWLRDEASVVRDAAGQPLFLQGILIDITQSKKAEEELREHRYRLEELVTKRTAALSRANEQLRQEMIERGRANDALFEEKERALVTLESIADAVITTNAAGQIEYLNRVAEQLTGWSGAEAQGRSLLQVLNIVDETTREPAQDPVSRCLRDGCATSLANHTLLLRRDGTECAITDSAAAIHDRNGQVIGAVIVFHDVTQEHLLTERLSHQATHDALTGLVNRQEFERRVARVLESAREDQSLHALCYLDLDQFKVINDTAGHAAGDELLRQVSALLQDKLRHRDTLARIGGDEFGVLVEHCALDPALNIASELREALQDFRFLWDSKTFAIGVSIGLVQLSATTESLAAALNAADTACYGAKQGGRNRVQLYQPDESQVAEHSARVQWVARLSRALDENLFCLCQQRVAPLAGAAATQPHYEILLRLRDEDGSLILPDAFLPAAERYNLMPAIDRWVLRHTVASYAARFGDTPEQERPVYAVNVSGASFGDESFVEFIRDLLHQHQVPATALCFEISEGATLANLLHAARFVHALKELGCLFALDDFGSNLTSFVCLKTLPVDFVKIHGSFVAGIAQDQVSHAVVEAINQIAHVMAIQTVAEGVETAEILELLRKLGVDHAQGYAIIQPKPLEEL
jgi:diguanylate cyclase (GGDEF)-like protein/PAS domain S-box-containing protein